MSSWNLAICRVSFSRFSASWRACASASLARASRMNEMVLITVAITSGGHVVTWRHGGLTLTEVATGVGQPLPQRRRLLSHRIGAERSDRVTCRGGATYQTCFQLESIAPELFWSFQEELVTAGSRRGLFHRFESGGRLSLGAVSWIDVETRPRGMIVQAFHTFPDDLAIVKSQSLFEVS